jgi:hypothetical protein
VTLDCDFTWSNKLAQPVTLLSFILEWPAATPIVLGQSLHMPDITLTVPDTHRSFLLLHILFVVRYPTVRRNVDGAIGSVVKRHAHKYLPFKGNLHLEQFRMILRMGPVILAVFSSEAIPCDSLVFRALVTRMHSM